MTAGIRADLDFIHKHQPYLLMQKRIASAQITVHQGINTYNIINLAPSNELVSASLSASKRLAPTKNPYIQLLI